MFLRQLNPASAIAAQLRLGRGDNKQLINHVIKDLFLLERNQSINHFILFMLKSACIENKFDSSGQKKRRYIKRWQNDI